MIWLAKRRIGAITLALAIACALLAAVWGAVHAAGLWMERQEQATLGAEPPPIRERQSEPDAPAISFIESPTATCDRPLRGTGNCYLRWNYLTASATSGQYIISMTVSIDDQRRANFQGFFQESMYIPSGMIPDGFRVTCGQPGAGGAPKWGALHSYTIKARDTQGLSSANYGSVYCPADLVTLYLPAIRR